MKRLYIPLLLSLILILPGCGGGGGTPDPTTAYGYIVDQDGAGVAGVTVTLGTAMDITDGLGRFDFTGLTAGDYDLTASGGTLGHYLAAPINVTIVAETANNLGNITAYRLYGVGVVVESLADKAVTCGTLPAALKEIRIDGPCQIGRPPAKKVSTRAAEWSFLEQNAAFVYLEWEPITDATGYKVYFAATDEEIWVSGAEHPGDPDAYSGGLYRAYLDLDQPDELGGLVTATGVYGFKVVAELSGGGALELPVIQVSLGRVLSTYPVLATDCLNPATHVLSWAPVTEADGYRVRVYDEAQTLLLVDSETPLLVTTSYDLSGDPNLIHETYYHARVDAQHLDATGWPAEITRGIGGFEY
ncbi:MAG: carboxypeptidase-like regulatory domain-containing protein [Patescibacteria group bacterium]